MTVITSRLDRHSEDFIANRDALAAQVAELRAKAEEIAQGGGEKARQRHHERGARAARGPSKSAEIRGRVRQGRCQEKG